MNSHNSQFLGVTTSRNKTWRYYLYQPYKWLIYGPLLLLSTAVLGSTIVLLARWFPRFCNRRVAPTWARINLLASFSSISVKNKQHINPAQSYIVVANHISHFDILALFGWLNLDIKWVMKQELRKVPFIGGATAALGNIYIDRSDRGAALRRLREAKKHFKPGTSIIFFPEGARQTGQSLDDFKKGAFVMAKELGLPILPVTLIGTNKVFPAKTLDLYPGRMTMSLLKPISAEDVEALSLQALKTKTRTAIQNCLQTGA